MYFKNNLILLIFLLNKWFKSYLSLTNKTSILKKNLVFVKCALNNWYFAINYIHVRMIMHNIFQKNNLFRNI